MLDTVLNGHVIATVCCERAIFNVICVGESILTPELVERGGNLLVAAGILRDVDIGNFFCAAIGDSLLHFYTERARLVIGCFLPLTPSKAEGLLSEFVDLVLIIGAGNGFRARRRGRTTGARTTARCPWHSLRQ